MSTKNCHLPKFGTFTEIRPLPEILQKKKISGHFQAPKTLQKIKNENEKLSEKKRT